MIDEVSSNFTWFNDPVVDVVAWQEEASGKARRPPIEATLMIAKLPCLCIIDQYIDLSKMLDRLRRSDIQTWTNHLLCFCPISCIGEPPDDCLRQRTGIYSQEGVNFKAGYLGERKG
jgi:hypothetical protein